MAAVTHAQFPNHAPGRVLHLLHAAVDDQQALRDNGTGKFRGGRPAAHAAQKKQNYDRSDQQMPADGALRRGKSRITHDLKP